MEMIKTMVATYGLYIQIFILLLLLAGFFALIVSVSMINDARAQMDEIMRRLHEKAERTVEDAEKKRLNYGTTTKKEQDGFAVRLLSHLDDRLVYSGLTNSYPWLGPSIYIAGTIIISAILFLLGFLIGGFIVGFLFLIVSVFVPYIIISNLAYSNYLATEKDLEYFISSVSSNAIASADLMTILRKVSPSCSEPVKSAIGRATATMNATAKADAGVARLVREIEYPLFKEFIRNLDICGKQDADFRAVAEDFQKQAEMQLRAIERQRAIFVNARNEVLLMIGMGVLLTFMTANFSEMTVWGMINDMRHSLLGIVCLAGEVIIYASALIYILVGKRK